MEGTLCNVAMEGLTSLALDRDRLYAGPTFVPWNFATEYPALKMLLFGWEVKCNCCEVLLFTKINYWMAPTVAALYLTFCYVGPALMRNRRPLDLKTPLMWWNLGLALFSFLGAIRVILQFSHLVHRFGLVYLLTAPPALTLGTGPAGFWSSVFVYSKFVELADTVFIVLRKKELTFLHWYHHVTVLLYTWDGYTTEQPAGFVFASMNYVVHAAMYLYYYLSIRLNRRLPWAPLVTIAQISQMLLGVAVTIFSLYKTTHLEYRSKWTLGEALELPGKTHHAISTHNLYYACAMYSTYVYLFVSFFVRRYVLGSNNRWKQREAKGKKKARGGVVVGGETEMEDAAAAEEQQQQQQTATTTTTSAASSSTSSPSLPSRDGQFEEQQHTGKGAALSDISTSARSSDDDDEALGKRHRPVAL